MMPIVQDPSGKNISCSKIVIFQLLIYTAETVETEETEETVEAVETAEAECFTEDLKKYDSLTHSLTQ